MPSIFAVLPLLRGNSDTINQSNLRNVSAYISNILYLNTIVFKAQSLWGRVQIKLIKSNWIKCRFLRRGEKRSTRGKTCHSREENQQTQPTYDAKFGNRTRATLLGGECSRHNAYFFLELSYNGRLIYLTPEVMAHLFVATWHHWTIYSNA